LLLLFFWVVPSVFLEVSNRYSNPEIFAIFFGHILSNSSFVDDSKFRQCSVVVVFCVSGGMQNKHAVLILVSYLQSLRKRIFLQPTKIHML